MTKQAFVKKCPGNKNSKGESAEWCIVDHNTGKILSSHKTEEAAKSHRRDMEIHKKKGMYKQLIKRKLAYMMQTQNPSVINSPAMPKSYQRFNDDKAKEIIVWIRQLKGMDKNQIKDEIISKFNISDEDAERLYYEAYPDGLSSQEEELIEYFEQILPQQQCPQFLDDAIVIVIQQDEPSQLEQYGAEDEASALFLDFLNSMLHSRKLIQ